MLQPTGKKAMCRSQIYAELSSQNFRTEATYLADTPLIICNEFISEVCQSYCILHLVYMHNQ